MEYMSDNLVYVIAIAVIIVAVALIKKFVGCALRIVILIVALAALAALYYYNYMQ